MSESWHLSKSVPITFIVAIVMQTIALVWYVSTLDSSIKQNARDLTKHETRLETLEKTVQTQAVTRGRIDENLKAIRDIVEQMARRQDER